MFKYIEDSDMICVYLYYYLYKFGARLNIALRGNVISSGAGKVGVVFVGGKQCDFRKIIEISDCASKEREFNSVGFLMCLSTEGSKGLIISMFQKRFENS